jgi:hypothetical protein
MHRLYPAFQEWLKMTEERGEAKSQGSSTVLRKDFNFNSVGCNSQNISR